MWQPNYTITDKMLYDIRQVGEVIGWIRSIGLPGSALAKLENDARVLSTFASTSIEGNPMPLTDVKRVIKQMPRHIRDTEKEVINYNDALEYVYDKVKRQEFVLSHEEIQYVQSLVVNGLMENPEDIGKYRKSPVVIRDPKDINSTVFIPPDYKDVYPLMGELISFVNSNLGKTDPMLLAGLFHKQHVVIHPFMDGNGRSTRLLTTALLGSSGLDFFEIFSLENYYNRNVTRYFRNVGLFGDYYELKNNVDYTQWLQYFVEGVLDELQRVQSTLSTLKVPARLEQHHRDILEYIGKNGSITQREYGAFSSRSLAARKQDFQRLIQLGLIRIEGKGKASYYVESQ